MILFHAKRDGTVTTTPNFAPQGSSMQDLVVMSEFDYAYCAIKILPASGEYIEDIPCTPILQRDFSTIFTAPLPAKATVVAGSVDYQLIFTAADGTTQTTLVGSFSVPRGVPVATPPTVGDLSVKTVGDLYAIMANTYGLFAGHELDIADLIKHKSSAGTVAIPVSEWTDASPTTANVTVSGADGGSIVLLLPANEKTRVNANNARLSAYPVALISVGGSSVPIFRAEAEVVPDADMTFAYVVLKTGLPFTSPIAAIVGVDAYGAETEEPTSVDLSGFAPDENGKGRIVETYANRTVVTELTYDEEGRITKIGDTTLEWGEE